MTITLRYSAVPVSGSSTFPNVVMFRHIKAAPAIDEMAVSQTSAPTLTHAGENTKRARN